MLGDLLRGWASRRRGSGLIHRHINKNNNWHICNKPQSILELSKDLHMHEVTGLSQSLSEAVKAPFY